jgi:hypothetical protein
VIKNLDFMYYKGYRGNFCAEFSLLVTFVGAVKQLEQ